VDDSPTPGTPIAACFTPCSESLSLPDGTFRYCGPDGLMEGCIGGLECVQGSCVGDGVAPTCAQASECPEHQACIDGGCWSNCNTDSDCGGGALCHERVCRASCATAGATCDAG